jgi:hypothetical protein
MEWRDSSMDEKADMAEKINELLGAVAALKAYVVPGAAVVVACRPVTTATP